MRVIPKNYVCGISAVFLLAFAKAQPQFVGSGQPSPAEWQSLNASLSGRLQILRPWAAVCYSSDPLFGPTMCQQVLSQYGNDTIRAQQPPALMWPNLEACGNGHGCGLNISDPQVVNGATCEQGTTPSYSVAIMNAQEASTVVQWAVANDVILTVKNSGHDLTGRSFGPGTLQVNVAQLQNEEYVPQFVPAGSQDPPVSAITIGGGVRTVNISSLAERVNVSVTLGSCSTVGAGGYYSGGGHGPLTPTLGLGSDSVLQYEIITADGTIRTINAVQDADLFWAVRGGGAGWGIITSITIRAYPTMGVGGSFLTIQPNPIQNSSELAIQMIAMLGKYQNSWIDAGVAPGVSLGKTLYQMDFLWPSPNNALPLLFPFFEDLRSLSGNYTVVSNETAVQMFNSYSEQELTFQASADASGFPGSSLQMSSRLVPRSFLSSSDSIRKVAEAIWAGSEVIAAVAGDSGNSSNFIVSTIISGAVPGASHLRGRINETGANPALYEATWLVEFISIWDTFVSDNVYNDYVTAVAHSADPLTELGIVGSYQGQANPNEVNWQEAFFGYKYSNLTSIKRKYDPMNFFNTWKGVDFVEDRPSYQCYPKNAPRGA